MNAASVTAIGMNPDEPVVTYDLLHAAYAVAVWRHDMIREVLDPFDPAGPPRLTVVQQSSRPTGYTFGKKRGGHGHP
jgi:hypothetical protein